MCLVHSYRKIPGDKCEGGQIPDRKEINLKQRCVSDLLGPELLVSTSHMIKKTLSEEIICSLFYPVLPTVNWSYFFLLLQVKKPSSKTPFIVITVIIVLLLSIVAGVMFVKKYVCGGRSVYLSTCIFSLSTGYHVSNRV